MDIDKIKCVGVCEECRNLFYPEELEPSDKWGHVCKLKRYKKEHRCESYIEKYYARPNG